MYNYIFLIGRIVRNVEIQKTKNNVSVATMTLAVNRPFKNPQTNVCDVDFINVTIWNPLCETVAEWKKKGDLVGVKGRIQNRVEHLEDGKETTSLEIIGERVIFLSSLKDVEDAKDLG